MHLASGNVPVKYKELPGGFRGTDATVREMSTVATGKFGSRSPKIRALACNIILQAGVREKDYVAEAMALGTWVRDNIRYMKDVYGQETISHPEEVAFNMRAGDCLIGETKLLTPDGLVSISNIKVGDIIWGKDGWTEVVNWWDKGILPTKTHHLCNGGAFTATDDHRCFLATEEEVLAKDLREGDALLSPRYISGHGKDAGLSLTDLKFIGIYIADGWCDQSKKALCISGKDGHPKEDQKQWVRDYAAAKGWSWTWHERYIVLKLPKDDVIWQELSTLGTAESKRVPEAFWRGLDREHAHALLTGLMSDSYDPDHIFTYHTPPKKRKRAGGLCFSTISHELATQVRMLFKMQGISVKDSLIVKHGGLGLHAIHRIYPRMLRTKPVTVQEIEPAGVQHVYDVETVDHGIYLPEADVIVHNCDDQSILLAALLNSVGIPARFKVMGVTPMQYSHVYLQANPGNRWITMDPIMTNKPIGWEVPKARRAIEKVYPVMGPGGYAPNQGVDGMNGLGYVGDPRVVSHLEESTIPAAAGTGRNPPRSPGRPSYVQMPSGLDTDIPVDHLMAFHPNANTGQRIAPGITRRTAPVPQELTSTGVRRALPAGYDASERAAMDGMHGVYTPDELAGIPNAINDQSVPAYMQSKVVVQSPEGVDAEFSRASLVVDPRKGDKVEYYGATNLAERPPIRAYNDVSGNPDMLPGMGMVGPGLGAKATGNEQATGYQMPAGSMPTTAASKGSHKGLLVLAGVAAVAAIISNRIGSKKR